MTLDGRAASNSTTKISINLFFSVDVVNEVEREVEGEALKQLPWTINGSFGPCPCVLIVSAFDLDRLTDFVRCSRNERLFGAIWCSLA